MLIRKKKRGRVRKDRVSRSDRWVLGLVGVGLLLHGLAVGQDSPEWRGVGGERTDILVVHVLL